jgi:glycosyltransferase involved in cell wall biosynthesis
MVGDPWRGDYAFRPAHDDCQRIVAELSSTPWIEWHVRLSNEELFCKLARCNAFVFPTLDESLGWVVLEAKAMGIPVIATNVFALPELVRDGKDGRLIRLPLNKDRRWRGLPSLNPPPRPSYEDAMSIIKGGIVDAVEELVTDRSLCLSMGRSARQHFDENYSESIAARKLAAMLRQVLA